MTFSDHLILQTIHFLLVHCTEMECHLFNMIFSYLSNRTHQTKINECFSERCRIEHGVPQGSRLGPLLFNIDLIDLIYECEESNIASYADDTTPYSCARDTQTVISELKSLTNFFTGCSIITLKPILENVIYF